MSDGADMCCNIQRCRITLTGDSCRSVPSCRFVALSPLIITTPFMIRQKRKSRAAKIMPPRLIKNM